MMRFVYALVFVVCGMCHHDPLLAQCGCGPACPCGGAAASAPLEIHWTKDDDSEHWFGLFVNGEQVAAYNSRTCRVHLYDPACGCWLESKPGGFEQLPGGREPLTNGMERRLIKPQGERWELNGKPVSPAAGKAAIAGDDKIPDDSAVPSLTLIGNDADVGKVIADMTSDKELSQISARFLLQTFKSDNPLITKDGHIVNGRPTIYAQTPDGGVLFHVDSYPGAGQLKQALALALDKAEQLRKPDPNYRPADDTGLVVKPQVDATIATPPWMMVVTHILALVAGAGGALGGRWALVGMLASAVESAIEARIKQPPSGGTAAGNAQAPPASVTK